MTPHETAEEESREDDPEMEDYHGGLFLEAPPP